MRISVIVPTYKRVNELKRVLEALRGQERLPDEILVVVRDEDADTVSFIESCAGPVRKVAVCKGGQVNAMNAGIEAAAGDILVFTDDDTVPDKAWLRRIERHFISDPNTGAVGGRDIIHLDGEALQARSEQVGIITAYGRIIGNHHAGYGSARKVHHLKGANMSFRGTALDGIRCDTGLMGTGAQYRNDMALCLAVRNKGWKIVYDPDVVVDHFYAARHDEDVRGVFDPEAAYSLAYNDLYVALKYMRGYFRIVCSLYDMLVGTIAAPGLLQFLRLIKRRDAAAWPKFSSAISGRTGAICKILRSG